VLTVGTAQNEYAEKVNAALLAAGLRSEADTRFEKIGFKIREAQMQKTPYMLVVGEREEEEGTVTVRARTGENLGAMPLDEFIAKVVKENATRYTEHPKA
jgi:threonyl-tRNA synthetase